MCTHTAIYTPVYFSLVPYSAYPSHEKAHAEFAGCADTFTNAKTYIFPFCTLLCKLLRYVVNNSKQKKVWINSRVRVYLKAEHKTKR